MRCVRAVACFIPTEFHHDSKCSAQLAAVSASPLPPERCDASIAWLGARPKAGWLREATTSRRKFPGVRGHDGLRLRAQRREPHQLVELGVLLLHQPGREGPPHTSLQVDRVTAQPSADADVVSWAKRTCLHIRCAT